MKLRDIINNVDKSNPDWVNYDTISNEFDIYGVWFDGDSDDDPLKSYYAIKWLCTDSWVGMRVYFLHDEPVCISTQQGRKSDEEFEWLSVEAKDKTRDYLRSLVDEDNEDRCTILTEEDLEKDYEEGYKIGYTGQLLTDTAIDDETGEMVTVSAPKVAKGEYRDPIEQRVIITFDDGRESETTIDQITIPYNVCTNK
jgi:hypothetical protein